MCDEEIRSKISVDVNVRLCPMAVRIRGRSCNLVLKYLLEV